LGIEAAIALILALASGLSELHKDLLVGFAIGFPALTLTLTLTLVLIVVLLARKAPGGPTSPEEP